MDALGRMARHTEVSGSHVAALDGRRARRGAFGGPNEPGVRDQPDAGRRVSFSSTGPRPLGGAGGSGSPVRGDGDAARRAPRRPLRPGESTLHPTPHPGPAHAFPRCGRVRTGPGGGRGALPPLRRGSAPPVSKPPFPPGSPVTTPFLPGFRGRNQASLHVGGRSGEIPEPTG